MAGDGDMEEDEHTPRSALAKHDEKVEARGSGVHLALTGQPTATNPNCCCAPVRQQAYQLMPVVCTAVVPEQNTWI